MPEYDNTYLYPLGKRTFYGTKEGVLNFRYAYPFTFIKDNLEEYVYKIINSLESYSNHPLSKALLNYLDDKNINNLEVNNFEEIPGYGVKGIIDNKIYKIGNMKMMDCDLSYFDDKVDKYGKSVIYIKEDDSVLGVISISDEIKKDSKKALEILKSKGYEIVVLTGDAKDSAYALTKDLAVDKVISDILPHEKENEIVKLQKEGKVVAMVGDGINDAPSLMRADVGIAIGNGTDIAIDAADIVLMNSNLLDVVNTFILSKKVINNIKLNLFWAFIYNIILIPLATGLFYNSLNIKMNPMLGAFAMSLSSVCVVTNALRLKFMKMEEK